MCEVSFRDRSFLVEGRDEDVATVHCVHHSPITFDSIHHGETQKCRNLEQLDDIVKLLVETQQYIYDKTSVRASMFGSCVNKDPLCAEFALRGECKENPNYMTQHCAAVCKTCR